MNVEGRFRFGTVLATLLIVGTVAGLYANSFSVPWMFDDHPRILQNRDLSSLASPGKYFLSPRGVLDLSFALNNRWGSNPQGGPPGTWGFHLVNLIVHALNGVLLYVLVLHTLRLPFFGGSYAHRAPVLALLTSLIFVSHPLQTIAVTYIVQRAESLASMFYLFALVLFAFGATATAVGWRWLAWAMAVLASYLGVLTKEIAATIPVMTVLYDYSFIAAGRGADLKRRWKVHALLFAVMIVPVTLHREKLGLGEDVQRPTPNVEGPEIGWRFGAVGIAYAGEEEVPGSKFKDHGSEVKVQGAEIKVQGSPPKGRRPASELSEFRPTAGFEVEGITPWRYLLTQFGVVTWYLRLFILPTRLCFDYGWPPVDSVARLDVVLPFLFLLGLGVAAIAAFPFYRLATFCTGWFLVALTPSSTVIPIADLAFEHRMYLAVAALAWLAVVGGYDTLSWQVRRHGLAGKRFNRIGLAAALACIAALGLLTVRRNRVYQDPLRLAADSATKAPNNWRAHYDLGNALMKANRTDEAIAAFRESIRCDPNRGSPRIHLALLFMGRKQFDEAEMHLKAATQTGTRSVVAAAYRNLGHVYKTQRRWSEAREAFEGAEELMPQWSYVHQELATLYARERRWARTAAEIEEAIRFNAKLAETLAPQAAQAYYLEGLKMLRLGKPTGAAKAFEKVLQYRPTWASAHHHMAIARAGLGEWEDAERAMEAAARLDPADSSIAENLSRVRKREAPVLSIDESEARR